jgi:hypothetical protein
LKTVENEEWVGRKGDGRVMDGIEWTKVEYNHSGDTLRSLFEH